MTQNFDNKGMLKMVKDGCLDTSERFVSSMDRYTIYCTDTLVRQRRLWKQHNVVEFPNVPINFPFKNPRVRQFLSPWGGEWSR